MQSFILSEVSDCDLLIVVTSYFFSPFFLFFLFLCVRVRVYLYMYVSAYLTIKCMSANDNVKHTKSNVRDDKKIN